MPKLIECLSLEVERRRTKRALSQKELGDLVGVSEQTIWNIENRKKGVGFDTINKLAQVFGCQETDLVRPSYEPGASTIPIQEHLDAMEFQFKFVEGMKLVLDRANALCQRQAKELEILCSKDPLIKEIDLILPTFDQSQKRGVLRYVEGIKRATEAAAVKGKGKKIN